MAPITSSQLLVLSVPAIAVLLNYLWYKRKRIGAPSDPGDKETDRADTSVETERNTSLPVDIGAIYHQEALRNIEESSSAPLRKISQERCSVEDSPNRSFSRSFSAPIPIVLPKEQRLSRNLNISDEELDQQIEKLKSSVKKTDPFELISQGKSLNSVSSFKSNGYTVSLNNHKSSPETYELIDPFSDNTVTIVSKTQGVLHKTISIVKEEILEEGDQEISVVPVEEKHKDSILVPQEIIPSQGAALSPEENSLNLISEVPPIIENMTSTSNQEISQDSSSSNVEVVDNVYSLDNFEEHPSPAPIEKANPSPITNDVESPSQEQSILPVEKPSSVEGPCSIEDRPSSVEERHSSADERPSSTELAPNTSQGAIPKKNKKKKFTKLDCDLKDLGKKLRETKVQKKNEVPERTRGQKSRSDSGCEREEANAHSSGRQSANESPSEEMMAVSSSLSSLNGSEGSNDSGKGCSEVITPPPQQPEPAPVVEEEEDVHSFYEFLIHRNLVGKLIGKRGSFVNLVYTKTNAHLVVKGHPNDEDKKVCIIEGTKSAIEKALRMVQQRFPKEKLEAFLPEDHAQSSLSVDRVVAFPPGLNLETFVSSVITPKHLFLQQPANPTYANYLFMHGHINVLYSGEDVPLVPNPIKENILCVAFAQQCWTRVWVMSVDQETEMAYVRCLDLGGYSYVHFSNMKQIRQDIVNLPFQATECFLANIEPTEDEWPEEAYRLIATLTADRIVYAHVVSVTDEEIPEVNCQVLIDTKLIWINKELVKRGYARWVQPMPTVEISLSPSE